jgi:hypothetical protein
MIDDVSPGQSSRSDFVKQLQEGMKFLDTQRDEGQSSRSDSVKQLQEGSDFLDTQRDDITSLWDQVPGIQIVSFYETKTTPVVKKVIILRILFAPH